MRIGSLYETCCNGGDDKCPTCGIPNYGQDHNYADAAEQGEDPATHKTNLPALTAAKMSNGSPHPWVVNNGINGRGAGFDWDPTKDKGFKTLYGEREEDAFNKEMHEAVDVCGVLSKVSIQETNNSKYASENQKEKLATVLSKKGINPNSNNINCPQCHCK